MVSLPHLRTVSQLSRGFGRSTPRDAITSLVMARWSDVRIGEAEVTPTHEPDGAPGVVHACIHLGPLLPVDVVVELVRICEACPAPRADQVVARLWSGHSYENGSYAFESALPEEALHEPGRLAVRVSPAAGLGLTAVLVPVIAPVLRLDTPSSMETADG